MGKSVSRQQVYDLAQTCLGVRLREGFGTGGRSWDSAFGATDEVSIKRIGFVIQRTQLYCVCDLEFIILQKLCIPHESSQLLCCSLEECFCRNALARSE